MRRLAALVLVLALAGSSGGAVAAGATPAEAGGSGCGQARAAGTRIHTVRSTGMTRSYRLTIPNGYTGEARVPLVVDLHGAGSNAFEETLLTHAVSEAGERGWIVATPDAGTVFWLLQARDGQDVTFLERVAQDVAARLCIAPQRRFVMGMSNGAAMSAAATCGAPDLFAAAAPVAGINIAGTCLERPIPLLAVHGTADPIVPYAGGPIRGVNGVSFSVPPVLDKLAAWSVRNQCTSGPTSTVVVPSITRIAYAGCAAPTELLKVSRGGHTWPGGPDLPSRLGRTNHAIDATEMIFDFFQATFDPA